jgi:soluble lytic murein transglycosylase-like protein
VRFRDDPRVVVWREYVVRDTAAFVAFLLLCKLVAALLAVWLLLPAPASAQLIPSKYDGEIKRAAGEWLPAWDWRWWKAQLYQESRLDNSAVSPVGARTVAQFMPATWEEARVAFRYGELPKAEADQAINAGAWYMRRMRAYWKPPRSERERRRFAQASYNAGAGGVTKAQARCHGRRRFRRIVACLAAETRTYVERIARWYKSLL